MLMLPITTGWLNKIKSGEKLDEYREIKPYWTSRLSKIFDFKNGEPIGESIHDVCFKAGYSPSSEYAICAVSLSIGTGKPEWGAVPNKLYYKLHIHEIKEMR